MNGIMAVAMTARELGPRASLRSSSGGNARLQAIAGAGSSATIGHKAQPPASASAARDFAR